MKILLTGIVTTTLLFAMSFAQDPTPAPDPTPAQGATPSQTTSPATPQTTPSAVPAEQPANGLHISPGSIIPVQLTKSIDAKKAKTGDAVEAKVTQDLKTQSGQVVVPKDTKVLGHITEAQPRTKEQPQSQLGIAFDHAEVKDKGDVPLPLSIQAVVAPPNSNPNNAAAGSAPESAASPARGQENSGGTQSSGARSSGMSGGSQPETPMPPPPTAGESQSGAQGAPSPRQPITGKTEGVVGIPDLSLTAAQNSAQGSVMSSEKNNVKLESGTFMLLRVVNQ